MPALRRNSVRPVGLSGDYREQTEALRRECAKVAQSLNLSPSVLAPKATLAAIARNDARTPPQIRECSPMMEWQIELLADVIRETLEKFVSAD
jgi:ribonuclease D